MDNSLAVPDFSALYESHTDFPISPGAAYVLGRSDEEREAWLRTRPGISIIDIQEQERSNFIVSFPGESPKKILLRSQKDLSAFWKDVKADQVFLDITSLGHHVWAPLLRTGITSQIPLTVLYAEPRDYKKSLAPTEGAIFDLSETISGIAPIPGFASLTDDFGRSECFVPLLGFEGHRLAHMLEQVQPSEGKIIPIIGVPGFRAEFVFHAYHGNRIPLVQTGAWRKIRFASANSPFALYSLLEEIAREHPHDLLKIAPIGTKPHAVGAFLFALRANRQVEFIYDYPIRRPKRTKGVSRVLAYDVMKFLKSS